MRVIRIDGRHYYVDSAGQHMRSLLADSRFLKGEIEVRQKKVRRLLYIDQLLQSRLRQDVLALKLGWE